jgi:NAD-specific glutamate dehydrogenase
MQAAERILQSADGAADPVVAWTAAEAGVLTPVEGLVRELRAAANPDIAMLFVASRQLRQALG